MMTLASDLMAPRAMHIPACWVLSRAFVSLLDTFPEEESSRSVIVACGAAAGTRLTVRDMAPGPQIRGPFHDRRWLDGRSPSLVTF